MCTCYFIFRLFACERCWTIISWKNENNIICRHYWTVSVDFLWNCYSKQEICYANLSIQLRTNNSINKLQPLLCGCSISLKGYGTELCSFSWIFSILAHFVLSFSNQMFDWREDFVFFNSSHIKIYYAYCADEYASISCFFLLFNIIYDENRHTERFVHEHSTQSIFRVSCKIIFKLNDFIGIFAR